MAVINPEWVTKEVGSFQTAEEMNTLATAVKNNAVELQTDITNLSIHVNNKSNPHQVTKAQVGLSEVDNTSDLNKPISIAQQTAINAASTVFNNHVNDTDNPHDVTKIQLGLSNVDNTSDMDKPISNAQNIVFNDLRDDINGHEARTDNPHSVTKAQVGLGNADNTSDADKPISTATQAALNLKENASNKGVANGYAGLDETGKIPTCQLPSYVDDILEYANLASFPVTGKSGKIYVALDTNKTYRWSGSTYIYITSGAVDSVAGKTGVVSLVKGDVGLENVDNTSDTDKPVSTAQQTALNLKADKAKQVISGSGLTGGGDLSADRTLNVGATDDSVIIGADGIKVDTQNTLTSTSITKPLAANQGKVLNESLVQLGADLINTLKCVILIEEEYFALTSYDPKTMYVITGINETTGALEITSAYLGKLKFATGGGGDVSGIPIEVIQLSEYDVTIERGATKLITASWQPTDATNTVLSWVSTNTMVASVNAGTITGNSKGTAVITVKARSGAKETVNVTVVVSLVSLEIEGSGKIVAGYDEELTLVPTPSDADMDITLSSSNSNVTVEKSAGANKLIAKTSATTGSTTIKAVNINGKQATIDLTVVPYIVNITSDNIDKTDSSVTSIFTNWTIGRKGSVTSYKYTESYMKDGVKTTLQTVDYTSIPENNIIQIELYAEFGNKIIDWTFKDAAGNEESITCNVLYKEPELINYSFNVDVTCTPIEAAAMTAEIPFFKYDKKYAQALRNDDSRPSMWRTIFRYCNRDLDLKTLPMTGNPNSYILNSLAKDTLRSPRRLCYTDGTGIKKVFVFDTAGMVIEGDGRRVWEKTEYWDGVNEDDFWKLKDYGGHFLLHNMCILASDAEHYTAKNENDYTYALQRDRKAIFDKFGYTSLHFCNPDGAWYYTRPVIKDPKTLLMSGGGTCYDIDPSGIFGKPANRTVYGDDLSNVPLYEIRNTLLINYGFHSNWFYRNDWITQQYNYKNYNQKTFKAVLTHCAGYTNDTNNTSANLINSFNYFQEIHDKVGANGLDEIWMCSGDEMIEYMYYQRCANVTKTITPTGCRFTVDFSIPNYLGFKTYSLLLKNLPSTASVSYSDETPLTYISKNLTTGLINWGYSQDISERANRYIAAYVASPTNEKLDKAWYFVRQMGEMGNSLKSQLPILNESPVIDSITYNATPTDSSLVVTAVNSNKEFGEAEYLDISLDDTFSNKTAYQIPYSDHKFYDSTNPESLRNSFTIKIGTDFGVTQLYYTRLRNIYGVSNVKQMSVVLTRTSGVNDPAIEFVAPDLFDSDTEATYTVTHSYISAMRYKLTDTFTEWMSVTDSITIPMTKGTIYNLVVQGKNNLDEIVERAYTVNFPGKQVRVILANVASAGNVDGVGYVNTNAIPYNTKVTNYIYDTEGNQFCLNLDNYSGGSTIKSAFANKFNAGGELGQIGKMAYSSNGNTVISGKEGYPETMIKGATNLFAWGGTTTVPETRYSGQRLYNVPTGTYRVRMMYRCGNNIVYPYNYKANDVIVSKNNVSKIKDTTEWVKLDNVVVDSTGYLYIGMNPQPTTPTEFWCSQLCIIVEITKIG